MTNKTIKNTAAWTISELQSGAARQVETIALAMLSAQALGTAYGPEFAAANGRNPILTITALAHDSKARLALIIKEALKRPELVKWVEDNGYTDAECIEAAVHNRVAEIAAASLERAKAKKEGK